MTSMEKLLQEKKLLPERSGAGLEGSCSHCM